jgi:hypothetical protein
MAHALAIRLRPGDALEIAALGETQESSFAKALARSLWAETYLIDGEPAVLRGVILPSLLGSTEANAWLMSGEPIERHRKSFMRLTRDGVRELHAQYDTLVSFVHRDYARSIAWLRWLGFEIGPVISIGPLDAPFHKATLRRGA